MSKYVYLLIILDHDLILYHKFIRIIAAGCDEDIINSLNVPQDLEPLMGLEQMEQLREVSKVPCHLEPSRLGHVGAEDLYIIESYRYDRAIGI